jgi:hypothetical protein
MGFTYISHYLAHNISTNDDKNNEKWCCHKLFYTKILCSRSHPLPSVSQKFDHFLVIKKIFNLKRKNISYRFSILIVIRVEFLETIYIYIYIYRERERERERPRELLTGKNLMPRQNLWP